MIFGGMAYDNNGLINGGINPGNPTPVMMASGSPGYVPIAASTSQPAAPVQSTATPTPTNVQNDPQASTVLTSAGGLLSKGVAIVTNPSQHIFGFIVLLVIGWFLWKHHA